MSRIFLLTSKALQNLIADLWLNVATVLVIAVCLTLVGAFFVVSFNASALLDHFAGEVHVMFYLRDTQRPEQRDVLKEQLMVDSAVKSVEYINKEQAKERFQNQLAEFSDVLDSIETNPLPASLEVQLHAQYQQLADLERFVSSYSSFPGVEEVYYGKEWVERLSRMVRLLWIIGTAVGMFLVGMAIFIISTTIRLTIHRRKEEIEVMRLVGATNRFIQVPFIIEGVLQGMLGASFSIAVLYFGYWNLIHQIIVSKETVLPFFPGFSSNFLPVQALAILVAMGVLVGFFGSLLSVGKWLKG